MSTQQQIDDPGQWRVGDDVRIEWPNGAVLIGKAEAARCGGFIAGAGYLLDGYVEDGRKVTVTRETPDIPEPTVPWALVKFADDDVLYRVPDPTSPSHPWVETGSGEEAPYSWEQAREVFGAPVAVSLPRWSDEVDGLRARVEKLADAFDEDAADVMRVLNERARILAADHAKELRALLAEGGAA